MDVNTPAISTAEHLDDPTAGQRPNELSESVEVGQLIQISSGFLVNIHGTFSLLATNSSLESETGSE